MSPRTRRIVARSVLLAVAGASVYLLFPKLVDVFSSWPELRDLSPWWLLGAAGFEVAAFVSLWSLQRLALRTRSWFGVATSQLTAQAAGQVVPGGGAAASAVQYRLLTRAGVAPSVIVAGLAASWAATTAIALALPGVGLLTALGAVVVPRGLARLAYAAAAAFALLVTVAVVAYRWDRPLRLVGQLVHAGLGRVGRGARAADLPERLLDGRDRVAAVFVRHPVLALLSAVGRWGFDYLVLLLALAAAGARPNPGVVLVAYAGGILLAMIPVTPGGLGFVELGLTGMLALAGVSGADAAAATLAYRLIAFWLPLPAGLAAFLLARRRQPDEPAKAAATAGETSDTRISPP